jgi:hypothetical protein
MSQITGFSNGDGVYVGITLFAGKIWWSWFTGEEWGPKGRDLCLSGHRARHETPIAAIAEYELSESRGSTGRCQLVDMPPGWKRITSLDGPEDYAKGEHLVEQLSVTHEGPEWYWSTKEGVLRYGRTPTH